MKIAWFLHALDSELGSEIVVEFKAAAAEVRFPAEPIVTWVQPGQWEDHTLNRARAWSHDNPDGLVLYMHTKGAHHAFVKDGHDTQKLWRGVMTDRLLCAWVARLEDLQGYDTSGVWWLT